MLLPATALAFASPIFAQDEGRQGGDTPSVAELTAELNEALRALGVNPYEFRSLFAAANLSMALGDYSAAEGFFERAQALAPGDYRLKEGLARIALHKGQARVALDLFAEADRLGAPQGSQLSDRGLVQDLMGENEAAQDFYRIALLQKKDDETTRRLALSLAITGDGRESERVLGALLSRQDDLAFRTRAFALAVLGRTQDAVTVAEAVLPARTAARIAPYLRTMPRLTPAQQAAAGNLGIFPASADIVRTSRIGSAGAGDAARPRSEGARLIPQGEAMGQAQGGAQGAGQQQRASAPVTAPPPAPASTPTPGPAPMPRSWQTDRIAAATQELPPVEAQASQPSLPTTNDIPPAPPPAATPTSTPGPTSTPAPAPAPTNVAEADPQPSFDLSRLEGTRIAQAGGAPEDLPPPPKQAPPESLDTAFSDFRLPSHSSEERVESGAVDLATIDVPIEKVEPKPPAHPSRHWVQVATGRDRGALKFDWRRIQRNSSGLLDKYSPLVASWNATNRLLAGPFDTPGAAQDFVTELKKVGIDSFTFTSAEGEVIAPLK